MKYNTKSICHRYLCVRTINFRICTAKLTRTHAWNGNIIGIALSVVSISCLLIPFISINSVHTADQFQKHKQMTKTKKKHINFWMIWPSYVHKQTHTRLMCGKMQNFTITVSSRLIHRIADFLPECLWFYLSFLFLFSLLLLVFRFGIVINRSISIEIKNRAFVILHWWERRNKKNGMHAE